MAYLVIRKKIDEKKDRRKPGKDKFNFTLITVGMKTYRQAKKYTWSLCKNGNIRIIQTKNEATYRPKFGTMFLNLIYKVLPSEATRITVRHENGNKLDFRKSNLTRIT